MISYEGGTGNSVKNAIAIKGAHNTFEGVRAEYAYISALYGQRDVDWTCPEQVCFERDGGMMYDVLKIILKNGQKKKVYFDIADFFGK